MAYKYTAYYYTKDRKTDSKEIVTGYNLRKANEFQITGIRNKLPVRDVIEWDLYDSKGVLVIAERWDDKKEDWISIIRKKKDNNWHPFGL